MDVDSSLPSGSATLFLERLRQWEKFIKKIDNEVNLDIFKHQKWGGKHNQNRQISTSG
jgi:hypothetical protein